MILITGGAGFIGSNLQAALHARGLPTIVVDWLGTGQKWRNLAAHPPRRLIRPEQLDAFLAGNPRLDMIYHLGAISETTATDGDLVWHTNVELSAHLWDWCANTDTRFVYASSAATYGNGAQGFDDDPAVLSALRPINLYGWTKHAFDLRVHAALARGEPRPPQWAGLKFFNAFGPNEYHKGPMISVVKRKFDEVSAGQPARLFASDLPGLPDGEQKRDFIWVGDVVDVLLWLLDTPAVCGLFNVGTGLARSYNDVASAVCDALGVPRHLEYVPMPDCLQGQYQSYTCADTGRLRAAGYGGQWTPLEHAIGRYITHFLASGAPYA